MTPIPESDSNWKIKDLDEVLLKETLGSGVCYCNSFPAIIIGGNEYGSKQTAGRDTLGEFAPKFAQLNDDVLFGEVWSREQALSLRDRSLVTIPA